MLVINNRGDIEIHKDNSVIILNEAQAILLHQQLELIVHSDTTWYELDKKVIELELKLDKAKEKIRYYEEATDFFLF